MDGGIDKKISTGKQCLLIYGHIKLGPMSNVTYFVKNPKAKMWQSYPLHHSA